MLSNPDDIVENIVQVVVVVVVAVDVGLVVMPQDSGNTGQSWDVETGCHHCP